MTSRAIAGVVAGLASISACTKRNPTYCEDTTECETGVCVGHACIDLDGPPAGIDAVDGPPSCDPQILFQTDRDGVQQLYTMAPDGSDQINVSMTAVNEAYASGTSVEWSPAGDRVVYVRPTAEITTELWIMNADGSDHRMLTSGSTDVTPTWSPDGTRIAFQRSPGFAPPFEIWAIDAAGGDAARVFSDESAFAPAWSPDGLQIAFVSNSSGGSDYDLWVMDADGSGAAPITSTVGDESGSFFDDVAPPRWSPDSAQLLYVLESSGTADIWVRDRNGNNGRNLTPTSSDELQPHWSSDGTRIVYAKEAGTGVHDIYVMNADGSNPEPIETVAADDRNPSFSADGARVAWQSRRDGDWEIYTAATDGTQSVRTTTDGGADIAPLWRPCL